MNVRVLVGGGGRIGFLAECMGGCTVWEVCAPCPGPLLILHISGYNAVSDQFFASYCLHYLSWMLYGRGEGPPAFFSFLDHFDPSLLFKSPKCFYYHQIAPAPFWYPLLPLNPTPLKGRGCRGLMHTVRYHSGGSMKLNTRILHLAHKVHL
jgi:hypothetical protein